MQNSAVQPHKTLSSVLSPLSSESGFSIVSAIFLLVVLSAMGAFMLTFSNVQQMSSAADLQGGKAYQAARAGIDWGAYQILQNSGSCANSASVPLGGNLAGFTLLVSCMHYGPYTEGISTVNLYRITATASSGTPGSTTYVERQLQATIAH
ncbi:MAG TPA: agglutinin biogenesis protein MshP [Burkholderiales bacterium]|nr:agglutinin biogenesis protein MshP [Burkholderiales bacterium]